MEREKVMEFTAEKLLSFTADELLILEGLASVAKEAEEAAKLIHRAYRKAFGIGELEIEIWRDPDGNNFEFLTHDGTWKARYLHQSYDIKCTQEGIFEYFRIEWLNANGFVKYYEGGTPTEFREKSDACKYFRCFISRVRQM